MMHKGVEFTVVPLATPALWEWQFIIGNQVRTGKTETTLTLLAIRRVQIQIDRALKEAAKSEHAAGGPLIPLGNPMHFNRRGLKGDHGRIETLGRIDRLACQGDRDRDRLGARATLFSLV
jgi:hypothetical protein